MTALTVVGFASGSPQSQAAMACIARDHRLVAIVVPRPQRRFRHWVRRALGRNQSPLARLGAPLIESTAIAKFRPDLIVVASFPTIIPAGTLAAARLGALNVHMSLLPRHRGPDPLFWTYWQDDRHAGNTVHWINDQIDAGDIVAQEALPLSRGRASREVYMQLAARAAELLAGVLREVAAGNPPRRPQDDARATYESAADIARARIPFADWPAERVWHVLSGLGDQFSGLVAGPAGEPLAHGRASRYRVSGDIEPGRLAVADTGYELHCRDGIVAVDRRR